MNETATCYLAIELTAEEVPMLVLAISDEIQLINKAYKNGVLMLVFPCSEVWSVDDGYAYYDGDGRDRIDQILRYAGLRHEMNEDEDTEDVFEARFYSHWDGDCQNIGYAGLLHTFNLRREVMYEAT